MVRLAPVCRNSAHRVFNHIWRFAPFRQSNRSIEQFQRINERFQSFVLKPPRATHRHMRAGRKCEKNFDRPKRWQPFPNVSTNADDISLSVLPWRMFYIHAIAKKSSFRPRQHHISSHIKETDNNLLSHFRYERAHSVQSPSGMPDWRIMLFIVLSG